MVASLTLQAGSVNDFVFFDPDMASRLPQTRRARQRTVAQKTTRAKSASSKEKFAFDFSSTVINFPCSGASTSLTPWVSAWFAVDAICSRAGQTVQEAQKAGELGRARSPSMSRGSLTCLCIAGANATCAKIAQNFPDVARHGPASASVCGERWRWLVCGVVS